MLAVNHATDKTICASGSLSAVGISLRIYVKVCLVYTYKVVINSRQKYIRICPTSGSNLIIIPLTIQRHNLMPCTVNHSMPFTATPASPTQDMLSDLLNSPPGMAGNPSVSAPHNEASTRT